MSQPARPDPAHAPSTRDRPAPAPPAHPQHRSPARRQLTTAPLTPGQPTTAASPAAATGPMATRSAATGPVAAAARRPDRPGGHRPGRQSHRPGRQHPPADRVRRRRLARHPAAVGAGHRPRLPPNGPLTVTFTRRAHRTTIHPATVDGLWAAAVTGHYTTARCRTPAAAAALQLTPVTTRPPPR
jgi:hypothetical protein